jgi:hypothetical protein
VPVTGEILAREIPMPTIYRAMKQTDRGLPVVGSNSKELGVRIPPNPASDVDLDDDANVICNGKGMSVVENWRWLLPHLIPKRLRAVFPSAAGSNALARFRFGEGPFGAGQLNACLALVVKEQNSRGGNVIPIQLVNMRQFQDDLAATCEEWVIDET